jgi:cbb3-type cytochrome oxidase maturation protein
MSAGTRLFLFWIGSAAVIGIGLLIWAWRSGQFKDIEEAKYRMLDDREPAPWPKREGRDGSQGRDQGDGKGEGPRA